eukprot:UN02176
MATSREMFSVNDLIFQPKSDLCVKVGTSTQKLGQTGDYPAICFYKVTHNCAFSKILAWRRPTADRMANQVVQKPELLWNDVQRMEWIPNTDCLKHNSRNRATGAMSHQLPGNSCCSTADVCQHIPNLCILF